MKQELNQNIATLIVGVRFAVASLFLIAFNSKSEFWLRKKAKYGQILVRMLGTETDNTQSRIKSSPAKKKNYSSTQLSDFEAYKTNQIINLSHAHVSGQNQNSKVNS